MIKFLGRTRFVALAVAAALLAAGCLDAEVTKKVIGGTSSGPFTVRVSCPDDSFTPTQDLTFMGADTKTTPSRSSSLAAARARSQSPSQPGRHP
jgi:hypothetical protein